MSALFSSKKHLTSPLHFMISTQQLFGKWPAHPWCVLKDDNHINLSCFTPSFIFFSRCTSFPSFCCSPSPAQPLPLPPVTSSTARRRASKSSLSSVISTLHLHSFSKICKPFYMHVPAHSPSMKFRKILITRCMPLVDEHYNPIRKECNGECVALNSTCRLVSNALFPSKTSFRRLCLLRSDLIYHFAIINSLSYSFKLQMWLMPNNALISSQNPSSGSCGAGQCLEGGECRLCSSTR